MRACGSQELLTKRKRSVYTVANPARGLLNREDKCKCTA